MLMLPGYWPDTYWSDRYWMEDYWPEHGTGAPPAGPTSRARPMQHVLSIRSEDMNPSPAEAMDELEELLLLVL